MGVANRVLVVDDDEVTRTLLKGILESEGFTVSLASSGEEAISLHEQLPFPIILSDIQMMELCGLSLLTRVHPKETGTVVILITSFGSLEGAVTAIQEGAFDYISKPIRAEYLKEVMGRALQHLKTRYRPGNKKESRAESHSLIGTSPAIVPVYKNVAKATLTSSNVLIIGESGTGKELIARAIHTHSARREGRFVTMNCGALTETLLESELFGHVKGSFTGAISNKKGLFEEANGGTIFLDEIGDITPALQIKLLRVIQEGEFKPVGSTENRKVDARVIAATHRDLELMVREEKFREDLYYRLKVLRIELPPLRSRMEDLEELVEYFLGRFNTPQCQWTLSKEAFELLRSYPWPGNIRELENAIERAVAMSSANVLYPEDFPSELSVPIKGVADGKEQALSLSESLALAEDSFVSLEEMERFHIFRILQKSKFNKTKAAQLLGIDRATLYRKAQRYGIALEGE